jgi:organic radical activating enzyme
MQSLNVNEIFYSLQGEGARAGEPSLFIRLQGCSAKHACCKSGIVCDTEFESGYEMSIDKIMRVVNKCKAKWIIWTGGEPTDQITQEIVDEFSDFKQSIECSGIKQPPEMDWIVLSPKIAEHAILKKWDERNGFHCDELRWVRHSGQEIPQTEIKAKKYYISPHFDGINKNDENLKHCIKLCLNNPKWSLSTQQHKLWQVL